MNIKVKEIKGNLDDNLKRRWRNIATCLYLLFSFLKGLRYSSEDTSSGLDSAVKSCSYSAVLVCSSLAKVLVRTE